MTAKEKAQELILTYLMIKIEGIVVEGGGWAGMNQNMAKKCAIICCDEALRIVPMYVGALNPSWKYWNNVKSEIEKL